MNGTMTPRAARPEKFRFPPTHSVPTWAKPLFTLKELRAFYAAIEDALARRASWFEVRDGVIMVHPPTGGVAQCGLYNVALRCSAAQVSAYGALVDEHFHRIFLEIAPELEGRDHAETITFADVQKALRIRIYNDAFLVRPGEPPLQRKLAQGLNAVVVVDYPNMAAALQPSLLKELGGTEDEAFACAIANCRELPCLRRELPMDDLQGFTLMSDHHYVTSQLLHLDRHLPPGHRSGALVALPTRHIMMVWPVDPPALTEAVSALHFVTTNMFRDPASAGEGVRLSKHLYWWNDGQVVYVPVLGKAGGQQAVLVPPEFIERMMTAGLPRGAQA